MNLKGFSESFSKAVAKMYLCALFEVFVIGDNEL